MKSGSASEWLDFARGDLSYARLGKKDPSIPLNLVAFHAQQALEKAIKALLVHRQTDFPKTHDIEELLGVLRQSGAVWPNELEAVIELTPLAVQTRYPGFDDPLDATEVLEAIRLAELSIDWVATQINAH